MSASDGHGADHEGLDLTSEPEGKRPNQATRSPDLASEPLSAGNLQQVQVLFRCCKVYWRFPIPPEILSGEKMSWFVHCPRCGGKLQLP
jgi:hypothetical protein